MVTLSWNKSKAIPKTSKPGPKLAVDAGATTLTFSSGLVSFGDSGVSPFPQLQMSPSMGNLDLKNLCLVTNEKKGKKIIMVYI